jgi:metal-dependent amidase/aminoacylase/carboxypeptidase family protein
MQVLPGATNVIPGKVTFSLDVRCGRDDLRDAGAGEILRRVRRIAGERGVGIEVEQVQDLAASPCDPAWMALLEQAVAAQGIAPRRLVSGAGHDAMVMAALCPTAPCCSCAAPAAFRTTRPSAPARPTPAWPWRPCWISSNDWEHVVAIDVFGEIDPPQRLLMGPGPVNAHPRVLRAMSADLLGQFDRK